MNERHEPMSQDDDLKARFTALRLEDEQRAPHFRSVRSHRPIDDERQRGAGQARTGGWWGPGLTIAFAVTAMMLWLSDGGDRAPQDAPWTAGQWEMPTDVLLDLSTLPGGNLLHDLPDIGRPSIQAPDGAHIPSSNRRIPV